MTERETDEYRKKLEQGPVGFMTVTSPDYAMGNSLAQWFAYCLLVGFFTAYVAGLALEPGEKIGRDEFGRRRVGHGRSLRERNGSEAMDSW